MANRIMQWALAIVLVARFATTVLHLVIASEFGHNTKELKLKMEQQYSDILALLRNHNASTDAKQSSINQLKAHIKHHIVPASVVPLAFTILQIALSSSQLVENGFSTLTHLVKRLSLQNLESVLGAQAAKLLPVLVDRLGDSKDRVQERAIHALTEFWPVIPQEVESVIRDKALVGKSVRAKQGAMQWILKMHSNSTMPLKTFVPNIVSCLEDADGIVRDVAKITIIQLFT